MKHRIVSLLTAIAMLISTAGTFPSISAESGQDSEQDEVLIWCPACRIDNCGMEHKWCHEEGDGNCTYRRILGDVDGREGISVFDALEVLKHFYANLESELDAGPGSCAWNAALIVSENEPSVADASEILIYLKADLAGSDFPVLLKGGDAPTVASPSGLFTAEIDRNKKTINYYNTVKMDPYAHYFFEFTSCDAYPPTVNRHIYESYGVTDGLDILNVQSNSYDEFKGVVSVYFPIIIDEPAPIPAGSLIMSQEICSPTDDIYISGGSIAEVVVKPYTGDVDGDTKITIFDALEVLKRLIGMTGEISKNDTARLRSLITLESQTTGEPTIFDALEILMYLVGMWGEIKLIEMNFPEKAPAMYLNDMDITNDQLAALVSRGYIPENVTELRLNGNRITDLTPLSQLTNLTYLGLSYNDFGNLSDITPLSQLTNLTYLDLSFNAIADLTPLSQMGNLTHLDLGRNRNADLSPLSELTNLTFLDLGGNNIADIEPLRGLENLGALNLDTNSITNIAPLSELTSLYQLSLSSNQIADISPLSRLTNLSYLYLGYNLIADLTPLRELTNYSESINSDEPPKLETLDLSVNKITDIAPLSGLANLDSLYLDFNEITDISPLNGLTNLISLSAINNKITHIPTLPKCEKLEKVFLDNNEITDITPVNEFTNLTFLLLGGNKISNLPSMNKLTYLSSFNLRNNNITNITPLRELKNLEWLGLDDNKITDIKPLVGLKKLRSVSLYQNPITKASISEFKAAMPGVEIDHEHTETIDFLFEYPDFYSDPYKQLCDMLAKLQ